jgi:hypothetical protein
VTNQTLDTERGVDADLVGNLGRSAYSNRSTVADVRAFGAFANDDEVNVPGVAQWALDARIELARAKVYIVVKAETKLEKQLTLENARRDSRVTNRAEKDCVVLF